MCGACTKSTINTPVLPLPFKVDQPAGPDLSSADVDVVRIFPSLAVYVGVASYVCIYIIEYVFSRCICEIQGCIRIYSTLRRNFYTLGLLVYA